MKYLNHISIFIVVMMITACGGGDSGNDDSEEITGKTTQQSVTLPATGLEKIVKLNGLTTEIVSITGADDWLTVMNSGDAKPSVKLIAKNNESIEERKCIVDISDKANNKVLLTVVQNRRDKRTFQQSVTLPSVDAVVEVELKDLKEEVRSTQGAPVWLTTSRSFKNGNAWLTITATDNDKKEERTCTIVVIGQSDDEVILHVTQSKKEGPDNDGIDDSHDLPTDQPAYSR